MEGQSLQVRQTLQKDNNENNDIHKCIYVKCVVISSLVQIGTGGLVR